MLTILTVVALANNNSVCLNIKSSIACSEWFESVHEKCFTIADSYDGRSADYDAFTWWTCKVRNKEIRNSRIIIME